MSVQANPIISPQSKIWFIQNITGEPPAYLIVLLNDWNIPFEVRDLEKGVSLPVVSQNDAVVILGGPMSANDSTDSMYSLLAWVKKLLQSGTPCLGICLGLQVLVKAAGGRVVSSPVKELGLRSSKRIPYTCEVVEPRQEDLILDGLPQSFPIFQLHGEMVELTQSMTLLAQGQACKNQIVKVAPKVYGLQGHFEVTTSLLKEWLKSDADLKNLNAVAVMKDWQEAETSIHFSGQRIFLNFLKIAGFHSTQRSTTLSEVKLARR